MTYELKCVLKQRCIHLFKKKGPTYPCLIDTNIKGIDQVFQEHANQPEVEPTDTPGSVHQNHDVCYSLSVAHKLISWREEKSRDPL